MATSREVFDELLVLNAQKGDTKALSLLARRWNPRVIRQIYWRVSDIEAARDISQDCWEVVAKRINRLRVPGTFGAWLLRIAHNKSVDWVRKQQQERLSIEDPNKEQADDATDREELYRQLEAGINRLEQEQKLILQLHYLEETSLTEMAQILNIPVGTVKSRLFRARENLKTIIRKYYE